MEKGEKFGKTSGFCVLVGTARPCNKIMIFNKLKSNLPSILLCLGYTVYISVLFLHCKTLCK